MRAAWIVGIFAALVVLLAVGLTLNPRVKSATQELALAFLHSVFDASDEDMQKWPGKHGALISRWVNLAP